MDGHVKRLGAGCFGPLGGVLAALPPFPGKHRFIDCAAALSRWTGAAQTESSPWPGTRFSVDLRDRIQRQMWCGCYEPHVTRGLKAVLRSGDTFLDVGAHIGYHSFFAAGVVGKDGRVFAFEPDPGVYARLQHNLLPFPHAQAINCAVWERDADVAFERSSSSEESGWGTLTAVRNLEKGKQIAVRAVSLDGWCREAGLQTLRAIKMDAEGSELAILRGAESLLHQHRPVLLLEINASLLKQGGVSPSILGEELLRQEYQVYELSYNRVQRLTSFAQCDFADCICLPAEQSHALLQDLQSGGFRL